VLSLPGADSSDHPDVCKTVLKHTSRFLRQYAPIVNDSEPPPFGWDVRPLRNDGLQCGARVGDHEVREQSAECADNLDGRPRQIVGCNAVSQMPDQWFPGQARRHAAENVSFQAVCVNHIGLQVSNVPGQFPNEDQRGSNFTEPQKRLPSQRIFASLHDVRRQ